MLKNPFFGSPESPALRPGFLIPGFPAFPRRQARKQLPAFRATISGLPPIFADMFRFRLLLSACSLLALLSGAGCRRSKEADLLRIELNDSRTREAASRKTIDSLRTLLRTAPGSSTVVGTHPLINGNRLIRSGLANANTNLAPWLNERHPELIPFEGVLGGTMMFQRAAPLADQFVFAEVSDGHVQGYLLLRYAPAATGKGFDWQTVYEWRAW